MKQPTFKEWEDANIFLYKEHWDHPLILKANKSAFHANDEYIDELEARNKKLRKGLSFYGDLKSWRSKNCNGSDRIKVADMSLVGKECIKSGGKLAREIVKEIEDGK